MTEVTGKSGRKIELDLRGPLLLVSLATVLLVTCLVLGDPWATPLSGAMMITIALALGLFHSALATLPDDFTRSGKSIAWMIPAARICCGVGFVIVGLAFLAWLAS